jgi:hypothetical protein
MVKESSTSVQKSGEDHNSKNRENDDHRDGNADAVTQCGHHAGPKKSPTDEGLRCDVGRGLRHAAPKIAVAHHRPQELTIVQSKGMYKYVFNLKKAPLIWDQKRGYRRFQDRILRGAVIPYEGSGAPT